MAVNTEKPRKRTRHQEWQLQQYGLMELRMTAEATPEFLAGMGAENPTKRYEGGMEPVYAVGSIHAGPQRLVRSLCAEHACCELVEEGG